MPLAQLRYGDEDESYLLQTIQTLVMAHLSERHGPTIERNEMIWSDCYDLAESFLADMINLVEQETV